MEMPSAPTTNFRSMKHGNEESISNFHQWNEEQVGLFFRKTGLGAYEETLKRHKITGQVAPLLTDSDLKEMGIDVVGDRLMFKHYLKDMSRKSRFNKRIESLWEGQERIFFSDYDEMVFTMCGMFPVDPSTYTLTRNHLKVKRVRPVRCGPVRLCCFGARYVSNNIDLSKVDDVDVMGIPAPCFQYTFCNARGKDLVEVESRFEKDGKIVLILEQGHGDTVAGMILNQVEESQKMERS